MPIDERDYMKDRREPWDDREHNDEEETRLVMTGSGFKVTKRPSGDVEWWWYMIAVLVILGLAWIGAR